MLGSGRIAGASPKRWTGAGEFCNPDITEKNASIALLMESAKWRKKESTGIDVLLFQKRKVPQQSL